jgi:hypothetical protein
MTRTPRIFAALLAVSLLLMPALTRAEDEKPADKAAADKTAEKAPPTEVSTQGTVEVGGPRQ